MLRNAYLLFLIPVFILLSYGSYSQDIYLHSQSDVDAFDQSITTITGGLIIKTTATNDPIVSLSKLSNVKVIEKNLVIQSNKKLHTLDGLTNLQTVGGSLDISYNTGLINIDGISNLQTVGGSLDISYNTGLADIDGLTNLQSIDGNLSISSNTALTNIDGLFQIQSVGNDLWISNNDKLTNIDGISNLQSIGSGLDISNNAGLINIDGITNLKTVGGGLSISNNAGLINIDGISNLQSIGGSLSISYNAVLTKIDGLTNLQSVGIGLNISQNAVLSKIDGLTNLQTVGGYLSISYNSGLTDIDGLSGLQSIGGDFRISYNEVLTNIDGLTNLQSVGGIYIIHNPALTNIGGLSKLQSIKDYLSISDNDKLTDINKLYKIQSVGRINISYNDRLINIDGISNLQNVGNDLYITHNAALTNIDGLNNLQNVGRDLYISYNEKLTNCCGIQEFLSTYGAIGGYVSINNNPSECSSIQEIIESHCGMNLSVLTFPPCIDVNNGSLQISITNYDTIPFYYNWENVDNGFTGGGTSNNDMFLIENLYSGTYNVTVTTDKPDTVILTGIVLTEESGSVFEIIEIKTTNSSNGISNGSIFIRIAGGTIPYSYSWSGKSSGSQIGITVDSFTIHNLAYGEYNITVTDNAGKQQGVSVSLLDDTVPVVPCTEPLDIVILNDVSGSVDGVEYEESKQFFVDFLNAANIGNGIDDNRAAIIEWAGRNSQLLRIPLTGNIDTLRDYINYNRIIGGATSPYEAMEYGKNYLDNNGRQDVAKVIVLSTDGSGGQISPSLIILADEIKAAGYHIITIAFDGAYNDIYTRDILRKVASIDLLAPGAPSYFQLNEDLAKNIVDIYLCPIDPGSTATAYFNRDGAIDIKNIIMDGNCPYPDNVEITFTIEALRELSLPAGTKVTFYYNNPELAGATQILTWTMPCALPAGEIDTFNLVLPVYTPGNIFAVLNDDGSQTTPISFPITEIDELAYSNNIDNISICSANEAMLQALKYTTTPVPACDTMVIYTIDVCNISDVDAFDVSITDIPPEEFILVGTIINDNGCTIVNDTTYDIPAGCCVSLTLTYDASKAQYAYYSDQGVDIDGPTGQTYIDFDGSTTTAEDVIIDGRIECPSTIVEFTKEVNTDTSCDDAFIVYTFTINNEMNIPLQGLVFEDILPYPCEWVFEPYNLTGVKIGNGKLNGNQAIFTLDEVAAQTVASFSIDAALRNWDTDGVLSNTATLKNIPDPDNGYYQTLVSNTVETYIKTSAKINIPDTIYAYTSDTAIYLEAVLTGTGNIKWTTSGDGTFDNINIYNPEYIFGSQDLENKIVSLFISVSTDCGENGKSVIILLKECSLSIQDIIIGDCNNNDTPFDDSDDTYEVSFNISDQNPGASGTFTVKDGSKTYGTFEYGKEQKIVLPADGNTYTLVFEDSDASGCILEQEVSQNSCSDDCSQYPVVRVEIDTLLCSDEEVLQVGDSVLTETGDYEIILKNIYGCDSIVMVHLDYSSIEVEDSIIADYGCKSGRIFLDMKSNNPPYAFEWSGGETTEDITGLSSGVYTVVITDKNGCKKEYEYSVNDSLEYIIPNAFFPSGQEELNRIFRIYKSRGVNIISTEIFDRWGEQVFKGGENEFWDGTYRGVAMPPGVYLYRVEIDSPCGEDVKKGQVILLR